MTIALLVKSDAHEDIFVPIATEGAFEEQWAPGAAALGLTWLPLFQSGVLIQPVDLPDVIAELRGLRRWAEAETPAYFPALAPRIDRLLQELERLQIDPASEMFIG